MHQVLDTLVPKKKKVLDTLGPHNTEHSHSASFNQHKPIIFFWLRFTLS